MTSPALGPVSDTVESKLAPSLPATKPVPLKSMSVVDRVSWAYQALVKGASYLQSPLLLGIRLYWGWQFFLAGKGKLGNLEQTTGFFTELGIPMPGFNALLASVTECAGGLLLLAGLASRLTSIPLIFTMCVAYATADKEVLGKVFSEPDAFVTASPFLFLLASLIIFVFGPGKLSIDYLLQRKFAPQTLEGTK